MVKKWLEENKLTVSEDLGDLVKNYDLETAEKIYTMVGSKKAIQMKLQRGDIDSVINNASIEDILA